MKKYRYDAILYFQDAQTIIDIEVASNSYQWELGLMYRKTIPEQHGLFFIYDKEQVLSVWMKNTYISLDVIFINTNKKIVKIFQNSSILSEEIICSDIPIQYVLEVKCGFSKKYNIKVEEVIDFKLKIE